MIVVIVGCGVEPFAGPGEHWARCWRNSRSEAPHVLVGYWAGSLLALADFRRSLRFRQDFLGAGP